MQVVQLLFKERHSEQSAQGYVHVRGGDSTASLGNMCQCSATHTAQKCFLMVRWNLLRFTLCQLPLAIDTTEKSLASFSLHPPFRYSDIGGIPLCLLFSRLRASPSRLFLVGSVKFGTKVWTSLCLD